VLPSAESCCWVMLTVMVAMMVMMVTAR